jgi:hypothetical protein
MCRGARRVLPAWRLAIRLINLFRMLSFDSRKAFSKYQITGNHQGRTRIISALPI